jgi:hypothetical protein
MRRVFRIVVLACTLILAIGVVLDPASHMQQVVAQAAGFIETFDGAPAVPTDYQNPNNWDILISGVNTAETSVAQHGPHCEAPGFPYTAVNSHPIASRGDAVFMCNNHVMTSPGLTGYGAIYMTPPALMDFSGGTATLSWDMSTLRTSSRDWVDIVLTPYSERHLFAYNNFDNHAPVDNIHIQLAGGGNVFLVSQRVGGGADVNVSGDTFIRWNDVQAAQNPPLTESAARRDTFRVQLSATHISMCLVGNDAGQSYTYRGRAGFCWVDTNLPTPLNPAIWGNQSTVQLDHRVYNAEKECSTDEDALNIIHNPFGDANCPPNTWHWDNVSINPAVPFSVIRPTQDFRLTNPSPQTVTFTAPAPANTNLEFITAGTNSLIQVSFDGGGTWLPGILQPALMPGHDESAEMVWMPVPIGTQSVQVRGAYGFWGGYESSGFNLVSATAGVVRTFPTATPTTGPSSGSQSSATATPTPTPASAAGSTSTPTRTATSTPTSAATPSPTPTNTATSTPGAQSKSLSLDGNSGYAEVAAGPELNLTNNWTVEAWFKDVDPTGYQHGYRTLIDKGDGSADAPFFVLVGNGNVLAGQRSRGANFAVTAGIGSDATRANTWQHVAATFEPNTRLMTLYMNGSRVASQTIGGRGGVGNALPMQIGRHGPSTGKYFLGNIDDVRVWNVVRSASEIQANYRRELTAPVPGLVANWQFNSLTSGVTSNLVASAPGAMLGGAAVLSADVHP